MQKSVVFLYTNSELPEREFMKTIPFTIASKRINYQGIHLTKEVKDLYSENYKILRKEIEDDKTDGKKFCVHGLEELLLLKEPYYPKQFTDSMHSLPKYQWHFSKN